MRRRIAQCTVVLVACATFGCARGRSSVPPQVTVALTPAAASVLISQQVQFQASVSGTQDARVNWSVEEGAGGGSVDANGLYTAAAAGAWHVVATSVADPSASGVAAIAVHAPLPPPVTVALTPASATLVAGAQVQFQASIAGTQDTRVSWSVKEGANGGSVDAKGLYTAPAAAGTCHVVATSVADPTASGAATVVVNLPVAVKVAPASAAIIQGGWVQFHATVTGTQDARVTWSVREGAAGGTVDANGLYAASAAAGTYHVVATSVADSTASDAGAVDVRCGGLASSANWPFYRHDVLGTGDAAEPLTAAQAQTLRPRWTYQTKGFNYANPVAVGSTVYLSSGSSGLQVIDATTGTRKWAREASSFNVYNCGGPPGPEKGPIGAPAVVGQQVFMPSGSGSIDAYDKDTGALQWSTPVADPHVNEFLFSSAFPAKGRIYIGVASIKDCLMVPGRVVALDQATGAVTGTWWGDAQHRPGATVWTTPAFDERTNRVFVTTGTIAQGLTAQDQPLAQAVVAFDADTMSTVDHYTPVTTNYAADLEFGASPVLFDLPDGGHRIAAAAKNGLFYVLDRDNLAAGILWSKQIALPGVEPDRGEGTIVSAAFAHGTLFVGGGQTPDGFPGSVVALDPATGTQKWVFHPGGFVLGALTAAGDTVIATATDASTYAGTVYVLDQSSGSILFQMSGAGMLGEATFAGGTLYVGDLNGALFALQPTGICRN